MHGHIGRVTAIIAAAAVVATAAAAPATASPAPTGHRLLQQAADDLNGFGFTGVQVLLRDGHRTTEARAGVADVATNRPVPKNGWFRMGSNTKTFASIILLQLAGEGRLRLDDTVERWLPGLVTGNGNDGSKITVRQLLRHQSGLAEYTAHLPAFASNDAFEKHRYDHWDDADLVRLALTDPPAFAPGTSWGYSNTNYVLAGMIIEEVTGKPWDAHLRARILKPAGMTQTFYPGDDPDLPSPHANAYDSLSPGEDLIDTTRWNTTAAGAAGGMVTTPTDLSRFWQALQQGRLLRPAQMREMHDTVPTGDDRGSRYGLGIFLTQLECGTFWGHDGGVPGMYTVDGVTEDGDRVLVVSVSSPPSDPPNASARVGELLSDTLC
ncbi:D-alanyl-D-alanine carboxypeptidase [Catenuloplanes nepalensis]|uniref:D-alanyl-D-alanine carboxypeptidase n=1 Tax=Catenuloplanes nepalensis TaxID=587533 RepID=A0ABT9N8H0_9ACTN|nr:serine hydrolase domain-containing protein [Catenuloplanes nepalensis]MDP9799833.1 D-alanyl-D-alanine carboxypeptidase [Catenuloplanes nepalensis]